MNRKETGKPPGDLPLGELVENTEPAHTHGRKRYEGRYVKLHPVNPQKDVADLYENSHGNAAKNRVWTYMP